MGIKFRLLIGWMMNAFYLFFTTSYFLHVLKLFPTAKKLNFTFNLSRIFTVDMHPRFKIKDFFCLT